MLKATHTDWAPWTLVDFNDQRVGRLTLIRDLLDRLPDTKCEEKPIAWKPLGHPAAQGEIRRAEANPKLPHRKMRFRRRRQRCAGPALLAAAASRRRGSLSARFCLPVCLGWPGRAPIRCWSTRRVSFPPTRSACRRASPAAGRAAAMPAWSTATRSSSASAGSGSSASTRRKPIPRAAPRKRGSASRRRRSSSNCSTRARSRWSRRSTGAPTSTAATCARSIASSRTEARNRSPTRCAIAGSRTATSGFKSSWC